MNLPNKLTIARVVLIPVFLVVLLGNVLGESLSRYVSVVIFIVAALTDTLDGYIARSQNLVTNFGKFMDPLADKLLVSAALIAMVELTLVPAWVVVVIISREFIVTGFRLVAANQNIVIAAGFWGKIKTATQMVMIVFVLLPFQNHIAMIIGNGFIFLSALFTIISAVEYLYQNRAVLKDSNI